MPKINIALTRRTVEAGLGSQINVYHCFAQSGTHRIRDFYSA